jgi:hypothetical protein
VKTYVAVTGGVFGLLVLAHLWRVVEEGPHMAKDPGFIGITLAAAALCLWASSLLWRSRRS